MSIEATPRTNTKGIFFMKQPSQGDRFHFLTALERSHRDKHGNVYWLFRCDCGVEKIIQLAGIGRGRVKSCGCHRRKKEITHGLTNHPMYSRYLGMRARCTNPNHKAYKNYGGRGISICKEWLDNPQAFFDYIGNPPFDDASIDRIDNDGNYEPENIRWATKSQQQHNKRRSTNQAQKTPLRLPERG